MAPLQRGNCRRCGLDRDVAPLTLDGVQIYDEDGLDVLVCHACSDDVRVVWEAGMPTRPVELGEFVPDEDDTKK